MNPFTLRPASPERDFEQIAALFTVEQDQVETTESLGKDYQENKDRIFCLSVAEDQASGQAGFVWAVRRGDDADIYLIVKPERRGCGAGSGLYEDAEQAARAALVRRLLVTVRDDCPGCLAFATRRGFTERSHSLGMTLDLAAFDDRPYDSLIARLRSEGFLFTSMAELGDTPEARRRLFLLNDNAAAETMGADGSHPWPSFEEFEKQVCESAWYRPDGQKVVIDTVTGVFAAMSATSIFTDGRGKPYAYNLFTGVERSYRGRKLAQAVKVLALRCARDELHALTVKTHHNSNNAPMIAIDRKLGYVLSPGYYSLQKYLE